MTADRRVQAGQLEYAGQRGEAVAGVELPPLGLAAQGLLQFHRLGDQLPGHRAGRPGALGDIVGLLKLFHDVPIARQPAIEPRHGPHKVVPRVGTAEYVYGQIFRHVPVE